MTDYEMIMIFLTILALLITASKRNDRSCEPPCSCNCAAVLVLHLEGGPHQTAPCLPTLYAIPVSLSSQAGRVFFILPAGQKGLVRMRRHSVYASSSV